MKTDEFTILRSGFDTIELSYRCALPDAFLDVLREAKRCAVQARKPEPVEYKGNKFLVGDSGATGGYAFTLNTGKLGCLWTFRDKNVTLGDPWRARVKFKAHGLATKGLEAMKLESDSFLLEIGARFDAFDARIGRADYAIDVYAPSFTIEPENFVSHSRTNKSIDTETNMSGNRVTGIRIGKMPNKQLAVYDKSLKVNQDRDLIWREIFMDRLIANDLANNTSQQKLQHIWRFEVRAGGGSLKKALLLKRWDKFQFQKLDLVLSILEQMSLRTPSADGNRARWPVSGLWGDLRNHCEASLETHPFGPLSQQVRDILQLEYRQALVSQMTGCVLTYAAEQSIKSSDIETFVLDLAGDIADTLGRKMDLKSELERRSGRIRTTFQ